MKRGEGDAWLYRAVTVNPRPPRRDGDWDAIVNLRTLSLTNPTALNATAWNATAWNAAAWNATAWNGQIRDKERRKKRDTEKGEKSFHRSCSRVVLCV